jgi:hypothetical protein
MRKRSTSQLLSSEAKRKLADEITRQDLGAFLRRTFETVASGEPFLPNWHHDAMIDLLERVRQGMVKRAIILLPPRHLKSLLISVAWPAFILGHDPTTKIIAVMDQSRPFRRRCATG